MNVCCDRVEEGNSPIGSHKPTRFNCGPFGTVYTVLGNLHFHILVGDIIAFGPIWFAASHADKKNVYSLFTSLLVLVMVLIRKYSPWKGDRVSLALNIIFVLQLTITVVTFFFSVGGAVRANHKGEANDKYLAKVDKALLGWIYPEGEMSIALDRSSSMNPSTGFGRFYTEVLELFYVTYYFWGYIPLIYLGTKYVKAWRNSDGNTVNIILAQTKLYLCGLLSAYILVFICNTSLPALSPRLYFSEQYHHKLEGFGLAKILINMAKDDTSFGSFPSGHFGESVIAGVYALRLNKPMGIVIIVSAAMIGLATQALRYHYFADILGAGIVCVLSVTFGFCLTRKMWVTETARVAASYLTQTGAQDFVNISSDLELTNAGSIETSPFGDDSSSVDLEAQLDDTNTAPNNTHVHALI